MGTNCSLSLDVLMTRLQCEKTALPFPQLSKVQVSVVPRCSGGGGLAQPALPTQCQPVSALLSSKKILRVTLTGPPLLATIITITIANTHFACRERCGQPEQHWWLYPGVTTPPSRSPAPFFVATCCSDSHQAAAGAGLGPSGEHNKDDVTTFSGDKSADWDAVILLNRFSKCWNVASVNCDYRQKVTKCCNFSQSF